MNSEFCKYKEAVETVTQFSGTFSALRWYFEQFKRTNNDRHCQAEQLQSNVSLWYHNEPEWVH